MLDSLGWAAYLAKPIGQSCQNDAAKNEQQKNKSEFWNRYQCAGPASALRGRPIAPATHASLTPLVGPLFSGLYTEVFRLIENCKLLQRHRAQFFRW
jgi:hypothetical protein